MKNNKQLNQNREIKLFAAYSETVCAYTMTFHAEK